MRATAQRRPGPVAAGVVVFFAAVVAMVLLARRPKPIDGRQYFYDMNTGELFIVPRGTIAPIVTPSGPHEGQPAGVQASIYACGDCGEPRVADVLYLMKQRAYEAGAGPDTPQPRFIDHSKDPLVRRVKDTAWHRRFSDEGDAIFAELLRRSKECAAREMRYRPCNPGD